MAAFACKAGRNGSQIPVLLFVLVDDETSNETAKAIKSIAACVFAMLVPNAARGLTVFCKIVAITASLAITSQFSTAQANDLLQQARQFEANGNYRSAIASYQRYLSSNPAKSAETRQARIKLPVLQETVRYGLHAEVVSFLSALDSRAIGDTEETLNTLQRLINDYPSGHLLDDAIFMSAYVWMMDHYNFPKAAESLQRLVDEHPDSSYVDTSLYSLAIVSEQVGDVDSAIITLTNLRDRHQSLSIAGMAWPKDAYLSRFWFERANNRLQYLEDHLDKASQLLSFSVANDTGFQYQASVQTAGRDFNLLLNDSRLISAITVVTDSGASVQPGESSTYEGKVFGVENSWARISIDNGNLRGLITVDNEQFQLHSRRTGGSLADFHPLLLGDIDGNQSEEQDLVLYPPQAALGLDTQNIVDRRTMASDASVDGGVSLVARVGVVVDSKFNNYFAGRGVDEALSILNSSDGIFRQQLGLALNVAKVILIEDADEDPMNLGSVSMETMMRNFREYRMDSDELPSEIGLATLFSGNKNSDAALGLAWIGSACRSDGYDVSVVSPYYLAELLSTHEIGHTLGAPHDSDTACANENKNIMWPFLSTSTRQQFSSCSTSSVSELLAASSCHMQATDLAITIDAPSDAEVEITVTNLDRNRIASGIQISVESSVATGQTPIGCSATSGQSSLLCSVASLGPDQSRSITLDLSRPLTDAETLLAEVSLSGAIDIEMTNNAIELDAAGNITLVPPTGALLKSEYVNNAANTSQQSVSAGSVTPTDYLFLLLLMLSYRWHMTRVRCKNANDH